MSSYVLDRELMLSAAACLSARKPETQATSWIDANSNTTLLGTSVYQRSTDTETRKQIADLQDQLKMLRSDIDNKDKLICELSSMREVEKIRHIESSKYDSIFVAERQMAEQAKKEMTSYQEKHEKISLELSETKVKVQAREERINEMKRENETLKSESATMNAMIFALKNRIKEIEGDLGGFENVANKSNITITTLQKDNKDLQQNVLDLESRIRTHIIEREEAERKTDLINNKLNELAQQVTFITGTEIKSSVEGLTLLIQKITDIVDENNTIKGKFMTNSELLKTNESENKANRETIKRLVNEINKFEKSSADNVVLVDTLRAERDCALSNKTTCENEISTLKERIDNIQAAWQSTKSDLHAKETKFNENSSNIKQLEYDSLYYKNCFNSFKEQVAALLSDSFVKVDANEEQVKEKIKLLMTSSKDRGLMIASMEEKINQLAGQLSEQTKLCKEIECKYSHSNHHVSDLENRLKTLDSEYCANQVLRDNLKSDRVKYLSFLERLGKVLKVSEISADVGLDMNVDLILARAEQLVKSEGDTIADKQTNIYNLQRKIKQLKEQLDNKDLHLDLLRKKLCGLEEEKQGKCALEREVDDHVMMSKKFKVKVEKLTEQLNGLKSENSCLKAQLLDCSNLKNRNHDQEKEIEKLTIKICDLEETKEKLSIKLAKVRDEKDLTSIEMNKTRTSSDSAVNALSQELRKIKLDLEKTSGREKQLLDFRNVVAKMLGLDVNTLAVADYEIIARIERIISTFNATGVLPVNVQRIETPTPPQNSNFNYEFLSSQYDSNSSIEPRQTSPTRRHHHVHHVREQSASPSRHHHHHISHNNHHHMVDTHCRQRSKSPRKNVTIIDPNSY